MARQSGRWLAVLLMLCAMSSWAWGGMGAPPEYTEYAVLVPLGKDMPGPETLCVVPLPAEALRLMKPDGSDARVLARSLEGTFRNVPFVVLRDVARSTPAREIPFAVESFEERGDSMTLVITRNESGPLEALSLSTPNRDFDVPVAVEGYVEGRGWEPVADSGIFDYSSRVDLRNTRVVLGGAEHLRFRLQLRTGGPDPATGPELSLTFKDLRLDMGDLNREPLRIDSISGQVPYRGGGPVTDELLAENIQREELEKRTRLLIRSGVPAEGLELVVGNPYFHRQVTVEGLSDPEDDTPVRLAQGALYRVPVREGTSERLFFSLPGKAHAWLRITVDNGDNPLLDISSVRLAWPRRYLGLYPLDDASQVVLALGSEELKRAARPRYELAAFVSDDNWQSLEHLELAPPVVLANILEPGMERPGPAPEGGDKVLLYVVVGVATLLLGSWLVYLVSSGQRKPENGN